MADYQQDVTLNYNYLLLDTIKKMRDSQASKDQDSSWTHFKFALKLVNPYLPMEIRKDIEEDYRRLEEKIKEIKECKENEETRKNRIRKLKDSFGEAHEYYIMSALSRVGIIKVTDEGVLDLDELDLATQVKGIIRASSKGLIKAVEDKTKNVEGK